MIKKNRLLFLLIVIFFTPKISNAQRLGIKPIIGIADNGTIHFHKANPSFAQSTFSAPRPFVGLLISYSISPQWDIEIAWQRRPLSLAAELLNPKTQDIIGRFDAAFKLNHYQFNITKKIKDFSSNFSLKAIGGFELIKTSVGYGGKFKSSNPDTIILPNYKPGLLSPLSFNSGKNWTSGFTLGLGTVWKVREKNIAELRVCAAYQLQTLHGLSMIAKVNGIEQEEKFKSTQLNYNVTLLLNLSTILGSKWKN